MLLYGGTYSRAGETSRVLEHLNCAYEGYRLMQAACFGVTRGVTSGGRVVRPPRSAGPKGRQNEYFGLNILFYTLKIFKLLG